MSKLDHGENTDNPLRSLTKGYILALSIIGLMSLTIHIVMDRILHEQDIAATIVSKTSSESMQIHRIVNLVTEYAYTKDNSLIYEIEQENLALQNIHNTLLDMSSATSERHGKMDEVLRRIYFDQPYKIDTKVTYFMTKVDDFIAATKLDGAIDQEGYTYISRQSRGSLIQSLSAAMILYENDFLTKVERLRMIQMGAIIIICITLMLEAFAIFMPLVSRVRKYADRLHEISMTDMLTGIGNRRYFVRRATQESKRASRLKKELCVCMVDIDHFKKVNDEYGHSAGDYVLREFVEVLKSAIRLEDDVARIGGEEFIILLPASDLENAMIVAERVRKKLEERPFVLPGTNQTLKVTASFGLSQVNVGGNEDIEVAINRADEALYSSKENGRNRISYARFSDSKIIEADITVSIDVKDDKSGPAADNVRDIKPAARQ